MQVQLVGAHARLGVHVLGILNHRFEKHRPNRTSAMPNSFLRTVKFWYINVGPDPLTGRPDQGETGVIIGGGRGRSPPAPMADGVHQARRLEAMGCRPRSSEETKLERRRWRVATWEGSKRQHATFWKSNAQLETRRSKTHRWSSLPRPRHRARGFGGSAGERHRHRRGKYSPVMPEWRVRPPGTLRRHQLRSAPSGPGNGSQRFMHPKSTIHNDTGREKFVRGMIGFWGRIVDEPDTFPPEVWQLFLPSSLTALGKTVGI